MDDIESAACGLAICDEAFGVGSSGGGLVVGLFIIPGDALNLVVREDS